MLCSKIKVSKSSKTKLIGRKWRNLKKNHKWWKLCCTFYYEVGAILIFFKKQLKNDFFPLFYLPSSSVQIRIWCGTQSYYCYKQFSFICLFVLLHTFLSLSIFICQWTQINVKMNSFDMGSVGNSNVWNCNVTNNQWYFIAFTPYIH